MRSTTLTDAFVGVDSVAVGQAEDDEREKLEKGTKTSHKLAILQGELTSASSLFTLYGIMRSQPGPPHEGVTNDHAHQRRRAAKALPPIAARLTAAAVPPNI